MTLLNEEIFITSEYDITAYLNLEKFHPNKH